MRLVPVEKSDIKSPRKPAKESTNLFVSNCRKQQRFSGCNYSGDCSTGRSLIWVAGKELNLSYHNMETVLT